MGAMSMYVTVRTCGKPVPDFWSWEMEFQVARNYQEENSSRGRSATGLRVDRCVQRGDSVQNQNRITVSFCAYCVHVILAIIP